ncbi:MAG TPA: hypothetical protein DEA32_02945 [Firmicutes bacterium]|nr:hypothetical protein [Bacillota bacterium]
MRFKNLILSGLIGLLLVGYSCSPTGQDSSLPSTDTTVSTPSSSSSISSVISSSVDTFDTADRFTGNQDSLTNTGAEKLEDTTPREYENRKYVKIPNSNTILYEDSRYTKVEEVAAYLQFFDHAPSNYVSSQKNITKDNDLALMKGKFQNKEGYLPQGYTFTEMDLRSGYSFSSNGVSRGKDRIVFGKDSSGNIDVVFTTFDHYKNFSEYLGYYDGWGTTFGEQGKYEQPTESDVIFTDDGAIFTWDFTGEN